MIVSWARFSAWTPPHKPDTLPLVPEPTTVCTDWWIVANCSGTCGVLVTCQVNSDPNPAHAGGGTFSADNTCPPSRNCVSWDGTVMVTHPDDYDGPADRQAAHAAGHDGTEIEIAILDTGIDSSHDDLTVNTTDGKACIGDTTEDGHGHGTHVAGTAAVDNTLGVIGVAHAATVVPVKVLDDQGSGTWESVICGVNHVTAKGFAVANMSLGGSGDEGACKDGGLRQAICESVAEGVTYTVAAGNSGDDASGYVPASYPEVITVSALTDYDGKPGGEAGCSVFAGLGKMCDDEFAKFSNHGAAIDVIAPGVLIYSTDKDNGYSTKSGTSMAAPHVAGIAALVRAADSTLEPDDVRLRLQETGECPNGEWNTGGETCDGQGQWPEDPDDIAEPLVNAYRAAENVTATDDTVTGTLEGTVTDTDTGGAIEGAEVVLEDTSYSATTDANGDYLIDDVEVGGYTATASADGYQPASEPVSIAEDATTTQDFALTATPTGALEGTVTDTTDPIEGAEVVLEDTAYSATTDAEGFYRIEDVEVGDYTATASADGYESASAAVSIGEDVTTIQDFALVPADEEFALEAEGYKFRGLQKADLFWQGSDADNIDVYRDDVKIDTVPNDGDYTDDIDNRGSGTYTYQVCEAGTEVCSNEATVEF